MDEVWDLAAAGEPEGTVVVAREQTAGRGRAGRVWHTPHGTALLFSALLRPTAPVERLSGIALVAAVAVAEALEAQTGLVVRLKWPNDVWIDERKVAGILVASRIVGTSTTAVLGIGLNVNQELGELPQGAVSLRVATGREHNLEELLQNLLDRLDAAYRSVLISEGRPDLEPWRQRAALIGEQVAIVDGGVQRIGVFEGIDQDGALLLSTGDEGVLRVVAGELSRGPTRRTVGNHF